MSRGNAMGIVLVYMTAGDKTEARAIGKALIESNLAACVNIIDPMNSLYRWEGKLQDER
jgi:periplasmic divalent cation tolerance protein